MILGSLMDTDHCSPQSESLVVCEVDEDLVKKLKEFRFRKETNNAAIISEFYILYWDGGKGTGWTEELVVLVELWQAAFWSWFKQMLGKHTR